MARLTVIGSCMLLVTAAPRARAQSWQGVVVTRGTAAFYLENGKRRAIPNPATVACLGGAFTDVTPAFIDSLPMGAPKTDCARAADAVSVFKYSFSMPEHPERQHIVAMIRMDKTGKIGGSIVYNNEYEGSFCGGIVVGAYDANGTLLQAFASPTNCANGTAQNKNHPGEPVAKRVAWSTQVRGDLVPRLGLLDVRAVATYNQPVITQAQAREALDQRVTVVSTF
jgi:hypothetical protein